MRRSFAILFAVCTLAAEAPPPAKPIRALLVLGGCCHDYAVQQKILSEGISARGHIEFTISYSPDKGTKQLNPVYEKPDWASGFDVIVHDECTADVKDGPIIDRILAPHRDGLPAVVLHCGMHSYRSDGFPKATPWFALTGLASTGHGAQLPIAFEYVDAESPITRGLTGWTTGNEELYNNSAGKLLDTAKPLARGKQTSRNKDGKETTAECVVAWTNRYAGKANVFATTLGHNNATVADPRYLDLVTRGLLWSCGKLEPAYLKPFDASKTKFSWEPKPAKPNTPPPPLAPTPPKPPTVQVTPDGASKLLATVKAVPGFDVTLYAAPPTVNYPTVLCAAPDGSVFIGVDPDGSLGRKQGLARIVRCRDTKNAGTADVLQTFAKVDSPRGLWWDGRKTLIVLHPPFLTAYIDDDGDGIADRSEQLVTGLGMTLQQRGADHTINGIRMGIDGWLYIAAGDYGTNPAVGKDGAKLTLHGGGVLRVRPDGTGLELVADGTRNIYDVGVSPTLDLFTRDNTNDGDGWDVRLSHIVPTGHYGYPSLYQHFAGELLPPMLDTGGGSPTGTLFVDEPAFGSMLLTCEWGQSHVDHHPLTPNGASYQAGIRKFLDIPRPTDLDVDGNGHLFVASWKGGTFDYTGPDVGFVARVTPHGHKPIADPDLTKANETELLGRLASDSHYWRLYAQRELLRREPSPQLVDLLIALTAHESPAVRTAAVFTLAQKFGPAALPILLRLTVRADVRALALKALADDRRFFAEVPTAPFLAALTDADPKVRLQGVIGLARLHRPESAASLLPRVADADPVIAHVAVNALVTLRAAGPCLATTDPALLPGALRVLQAIYEPAAVDGLLAHLQAAKSADDRRPLLTTLARLSLREAGWDGKWWGTRPDTTGPVFKPDAWSETARIHTALREALKSADRAEQVKLLPLFARARVELPEMTPLLLELARTDPAARRLAVELFAGRTVPPTEALLFFAAVAGDAKEIAPLRSKAVKALVKHAVAPATRDAAVAVLADSKRNGDFDAAWAEFVRDGRRLAEIGDFIKLANDPTPSRRELAFGVLATVADRSLGAADVRSRADQAVREAWAKPDMAIPLTKAVGRLNLTSYAPQLRKLANEPGEAGQMAKTTLASLKIDKVAGAANLPSIGSQSYEQTVTAAITAKGDAAMGAKLFGRIGCVNCHAIVAGEAPKGPPLAGISKRYKRDELIESILRPSAKLAQGFETVVFQLASGKSVTGFIVRESSDEVELRDGTGAIAVLKKPDIDERSTSKVSVMPEKLVDDLTVPELAALLAYLESLPAKE